jgi:hypothetical protein
MLPLDSHGYGALICVVGQNEFNDDYSIIPLTTLSSAGLQRKLTYEIQNLGVDTAGHLASCNQPPTLSTLIHEAMCLFPLLTFQGATIPIKSAIAWRADEPGRLIRRRYRTL